jgi:phenylpropionate dioxygenase-like ring-hydroxylating dioxygenase large terminal subunit
MQIGGGRRRPARLCSPAVDDAPVIALPNRRYSVARLREQWYPALRSKRLGTAPVPLTILDTALVLFRGAQGEAAALLDRCAHRNVPLSLGKVEDELLVCPYHGWAYGMDGACRQVPALCGEQTGKGRRVPRFPTLERHGFVWVYLGADASPACEPFALPHLDDPRYATLHYEMDLDATLHAALENILDVPHTAFLHKGLFRGVKRNEITAVVRRGPDRVEAEYVGEPRPTGLLGNLLAPQGGTVTHFDRFFLPSVAQVEYALGGRNHIVSTSLLTPISDFKTRLFAVVTYRTIFPAPLVRLLLTPVGKRVLQQDKVMLRHQTEAVQRFGGEQYVSTEVDVLGPHIWRLMRQAERGDAPPAGVVEERVRILA